MPDVIDLKPHSPWRELRTTSTDWSTLSRGQIDTMLATLHIVRAFEEKVLELAGERLVHGPAHSAIGQEGAAVGSIMALRSTDQINGSHRGHHQFLAKSLGYLAPEGLCADGEFPDDVWTLARVTLSEILGLSAGFCRGRGGSMHLRWRQAGNLGTNAIVGGGVPLAAGAAWCQKRAGQGDVVVTYFGDGAVNIGSVLETMNLAAAWRLPLCFFVENNRYAVSTTVEESTAEPRLSARGLGFSIPSWKVDGMDPLAVFLAMEEALALMRDGGGPTLIEADVYRFFHQNGPLPGSAFGYRTKEEEAAWRARDPLDRVAREAADRQIIGEAGIQGLRESAVAMMDEIAGELTEVAGGTRRIVPSLWPDVSFRDFGIRGDMSEFVGVRTEELESFGGDITTEATFVDTIAAVMHRRMSQDPRIVIFGEDIHRLKGGTNGATRGLYQTFPDRVIGTPICENAFAGLAGGVAMDGRFLPVVELMYADFTWVAADQLFNQIGKARHMFGGDGELPLVLRTKVAMGTGYGSQHSMDPAGLFNTCVGWRIVAPSTPFDYVGLMNSALLCKDPVLVLEHVELYGSQGSAPTSDFDYFIPLGKAKIVRTGSTMTILTYLSMVAKVQAAAEQMNLDAEIVDLRCLDRASLDWETIGASVRKTNKVLVVEQGPVGTSYGGFLAAEIQSRLFDWLDQPVQRVVGGEAAPSISKILEAATCAGSDEIIAGMRRVLSESGHSTA